MKALLRVRMAAADAHYGGGLVDGARLLALFGDVATEILIRSDGDEGLFRAYDSVEFLAPVHAGDYLEIEGELIGRGVSSRRMRFCARKVIAPTPALSASSAEVLAEPIVVARATGTCVVPAPKQRFGSAPPVIITAAIVGAETTRAQTPYLPLTAAEIAEEAERCAEAGAAVVHLHAREPDGTPTQSRARFAEFIAAIRARTDILIQTSTGGALGMSIDERCQPLELTGELAPDMATLNIASMNFGDEVFLNPRPDVVRVAERIRTRNLVAEIEIYDTGHLEAARRLVRDGVLPLPLHFQFVLGVPGGLAANERALDFLLGELDHGFPAERTWAVAAVGRHQLPMADVALRRGGHVRVGLEDNIYKEKGALAKGSYELCALAAERARIAGRPIANVALARRLLGLGAGAAGRTDTVLP
jgi:3-keto-5-aminohexanoate cleavage enzyme